MTTTIQTRIITYTAGSTRDVRGPCGHRHRTVEAAARCGRRDAEACARLGGGSYSDRRVVYGSDGSVVAVAEVSS